MAWVWCPGLTIADQLPPLDPREGGEQLMERVAITFDCETWEGARKTGTLTLLS